ncbi:MAG: dUTPase [Erysipelotrichaceae bacterium]|jgi:dimeric dUTPase (all-alpha-NTP-PPase superfamily)|nr:dUTP diphosphatase [Bacillota bacterium]MDY0118839.1 dUTP diphosphatase [Bacilli bacterium]NLJ32808.1 dUTPase [Erysipelotrichaceae bacterium]HOF65607.1 dUTP diphosphatase [Bacilli bacterium]
MKIDLKELQKVQLELDININERHATSYETTKDERLLALLVEVAELANATRTFKYWSLKGSEDRSTLLEEYADGLHFLLSLSLAYKLELPIFEVNISDKEKTLTEAFLDTFKAIDTFNKRRCRGSLKRAFEEFLRLGLYLSFSSKDIIDAYYDKIKINYKRQEENY